MNKSMTNAWHEYFDGMDNVEIVNDYFHNFMEQHPNIDGIVSPANSFGFMDGGYDLAIKEYLGDDMQTSVSTMISVAYKGYQPIGTCLAVPFWKYTILHTPTMRTPEPILDYRVIFDCMRSCLLEAQKKNLHEIVVPAFGGLTGKVPCRTIAYMMYLAFVQINDIPKIMNWKYAYALSRDLKKSQGY